jgi:hypothetical protein
MVTLHGLGGVGKSAIALEYAYISDPLYSLVFWVNASDSFELEKSARNAVERIIRSYEKQSRFPGYQKIARDFQLLEPVANREELIKAAESSAVDIVKHWLSEEFDRPWLLLIDNYDEPKPVDITALLPTRDFGHLIITSRVHNAMRGSHRIPVEELEEGEAVELLFKSAGRDYPSGTPLSDGLLTSRREISDLVAYAYIA